jgi:hypothetical protein
MDGRLVVLNRVVEALGEGADIGSFEDRKRFQKAVYLGQVAGIDLGYRYGWYIKGPYSTSLTRDYYAMAAARGAGEVTPADQQLRPEIQTQLANIRAIFDVPPDVQLTKADWLELLASWHYLRSVNRLNDNGAQELMMRQKPNLVPFIPRAAEALQGRGLL